MIMTNIGFGNLISSERVVMLVSPDSAPIKRLVQDAKDGGSAIDVTCGKKTKSVIILDSGHVVLSAILPETLKKRLEGEDEANDAEEND